AALVDLTERGDDQDAAGGVLQDRVNEAHPVPSRLTLMVRVVNYSGPPMRSSRAAAVRAARIIAGEMNGTSGVVGWTASTPAVVTSTSQPLARSASAMRSRRYSATWTVEPVGAATRMRRSPRDSMRPCRTRRRMSAALWAVVYCGWVTG